MNRIKWFATIGAAAALGGTGVGQAAPGATLCVAKLEPQCFSSIQSAVDAAHDGDTIDIGPGTFAGGITILKSIRLTGAGSGATTISGGGPVVTIGRFEGDNDLQVGISGVTITGGVNDQVGFAQGGGVWIPSGTVTIADSVVTGNRVAPRATFSDPAPCGSTPFGECAFAGGGGIGNAGTLTLIDSRVTDNVAGSAGVTSYAFGGGVANGGALTVIRSLVSGNRATVSTPNGRFADAGGISSSGVLTMEDSVVSGNTSSVAAAVPSFFPSEINAEANAGGLYLPGRSSTTITRSRITGNTVIGSNSAGDVEAEAGGIDSDGRLTMIDSSVDDNTATASVPAGAGFLAEADGGGLQIQNVTTLRNSRVIGNTLSSTSPTGPALASGGGIFNIGAALTVERTVVAANGAFATGIAGVNLGGGIANVQFFGPAPVLALIDSVVTANRLAASPGIPSQGGGLFNVEVTNLAPFTTGDAFPLTSVNTLIAGNKPDQCACG